MNEFIVWLASIMGGQPTADAAVRDLGDSIEILNLIVAIEQAYPLDGDGHIPDGDMFDNKTMTVADLYAYIVRRTACRA